MKPFLPCRGHSVCVYVDNCPSVVITNLTFNNVDEDQVAVFVMKHH